MIFRRAYIRLEKIELLTFLFIFSRNTPDEMPIHVHFQKQTRSRIFSGNAFSCEGPDSKLHVCLNTISEFVSFEEIKIRYLMKQADQNIHSFQLSDPQL